MVAKFKVSNFRSILDLELNLLYAEGKAPNGWQKSDVWPFLSATGHTSDRVVPILALYGANASGKTNIIRALASFFGAIRHGIEGRYHPNRLNPKYSSTTFGLEVIKKDSRFCYRLEYDGVSIRKERLRIFAKGAWQTVFAVGEEFSVEAIATENYPVDKLKDFFRVECTSAAGVQVRSWFDCLGRKYEALSRDVSDAYQACMNSVSVYLTNDIDFVRSIDRLAVKMNATREEAEDRVSQFLKKFDIGIEGIAVDSQELSSDELAQFFEKRGLPRGSVNRRDGKFYLEVIDSKHRDVGGNLVPMAYRSDESEGTRLLAGIVATCLVALDCGDAVFFDELDRSLHPLLLIELVKLFKLKRYNPHGAQLVFTAHDPSLMEDVLLRLGEIGVVNNGLAAGTTLRRLVDLKRDGMEIRNVHNFRKLYMDGFFTGIPYPVL